MKFTHVLSVVAIATGSSAAWATPPAAPAAEKMTSAQATATVGAILVMKAQTKLYSESTQKAAENVLGKATTQLSGSGDMQVRTRTTGDGSVITRVKTPTGRVTTIEKADEMQIKVSGVDAKNRPINDKLFMYAQGSGAVVDQSVGLKGAAGSTRDAKVEIGALHIVKQIPNTLPNKEAKAPASK